MRQILPAVLVVSLLSFEVPARAEAAPPCDNKATARQGLLAGLRSMESMAAWLKKAREALVQVPANCRDGAFFVDAVNILRLPENHHQPLVAEGLNLTEPRGALEAGLRLAPNHPELLAYLAYLSVLHPKDTPPLPEDACARVKDAAVEFRGYVCGVAAVRADRFPEAVMHLLSLPDLGRYPNATALLTDSLRRTSQKAEDLKKAHAQAPPFKCDPICPKEVNSGSSVKTSPRSQSGQ